MIPLVRPVFPDKKLVWEFFDRALSTGQISNMGPCFQLLTKRLEELTDSYCVPVVNGTVAIQVAVQSHFARGSNILMPDYTHIGTLQAITAAGCNPVMVPVSRQTWTMDPLCLAEGLKRADGAVIVSPFGYPVDFNLYDGIASRARRPLIYDLAGGWGMRVDTKHTVCFSLHATKNFSCGEGGLVAYSKRSAAKDATRRINFDTLLDRTIASPWGGNWKPDELKCAVILAHLYHGDKILERAAAKWARVEYYADALGGSTPDLRNGSPSLCVIQGLDAKRIERESATHGFMAKQYYPLLSKMPGLDEIDRMEGVTPSSAAMETCVALPSDVTDKEAAQVVLSVKRILHCP